MKYSRLLIALLLTVLAFMGRAADPSDRDQTRLASQLKFPHVKMLEATPEEAFDFIRLKSKEVDPAGIGVKLVVQSAPAPAAPEKRKADPSPLESALEPFPGESAKSKTIRRELKRPLSITYDLKNVSVLTVIQRTAAQAQMKVNARADAIVVSAK